MECALNAMPACLPRSSDFRVLLRVSMAPAASKAQRTAGAPDRCPEMRCEHRKRLAAPADAS